jgi:hypothetical protein
LPSATACFIQHFSRQYGAKWQRSCKLIPKSSFAVSKALLITAHILLVYVERLEGILGVFIS